MGELAVRPLPEQKIGGSNPCANKVIICDLTHPFDNAPNIKNKDMIRINYMEWLTGRFMCIGH